MVESGIRFDARARETDQMFKALGRLSEFLGHPALSFDTDHGQDINGALVTYAIDTIRRLMQEKEALEHQLAGQESVVEAINRLGDRIEQGFHLVQANPAGGSTF